MDIGGTRSAVLAIVVAALPSMGSAQSTCTSIEADTDRLACYDRESGRTPARAPTQVEGAWSVRTEKSEMTDDTNVYVSVESEEPVSCRFGSPETATLLLRCQENRTSVFISTAGCHLVSSEYNDYGDVTYRVDSLPSTKRGFEESTDNRALGLWGGGEAIPFIKSLLGHAELLTRFTPFNDSPVSARFRIGGLEQAIAPLREACGW